MDADALYQDIILGHFRQPRGRRVIGEQEPRVELLNPACGDKITLSARVESGRLAELGYAVQGCALCTASASLLHTACAGRAVDEVGPLCARVEHALATGTPEGLEGDLAALSSVHRFPLRHKCALLPWKALRQWCAENAGLGAT